MGACGVIAWILLISPVPQEEQEDTQPLEVGRVCWRPRLASLNSVGLDLQPHPIHSSQVHPALLDLGRGGTHPSLAVAGCASGVPFPMCQGHWLWTTVRALAPLAHSFSPHWQQAPAQPLKDSNDTPGLPAVSPSLAKRLHGFQFRKTDRCSVCSGVRVLHSGVSALHSPPACVLGD